MKHNNRLTFLLAAAFVALELAAPRAPAAAPPDAAPNAHWLNKLYPNGKRARDVIGMAVVGQANQRLGELSDLVIDTTSGRIVYAIVSSGGLIGLGETQHAIPFSAVHYANSYQDSLMVDVSTAEWNKAPVYSDDQFSSLGDRDRSDYLFRYYHQDWQPIEGQGGTGAALRRATHLLDREVRAAGREIGQAEDLIVDVKDRSAWILLNATASFAGSPGRYLVPFKDLTARTVDSDTLATSLTRSDVDQAAPLSEAGTNADAGTIYRWEVGGR